MQKQDTQTSESEGSDTMKHIKKIEAQPATGTDQTNGQQKPEIRTAGGCIPVGV